jgi:hypothetical protein
MIGTASLSFERASEQLEGMVQQGTAFAQVEDVIDAARLSERHKAALWLLAWSLREPSLQHREARLMVAAFATGDEKAAVLGGGHRGATAGEQILIGALDEPGRSFAVTQFTDPEAE